MTKQNIEFGEVIKWDILVGDFVMFTMLPFFLGVLWSLNGSWIFLLMLAVFFIIYMKQKNRKVVFERL